jgi:hypothetical protein
MTQEEKLKILLEAEERAYKAIADTEGKDMDTERFQYLLSAASTLGHRVHMMETAEGERPRSTGLTFTMEPKTEPPAEPAEPEKPAEPEPAEPETPETVENAEPEKTSDSKPVPKMEEVRGALAKARLKGLNVPAFLKEFGVDNFTKLPESKYAEALEKVTAFLAEKEKT